MTQAHHQAFNRAVVNGVDVDAVVAAVLACPGVARMSHGLLGEAATYLPGRRVHGVVVREPRKDGETDLEVRIVAEFGSPMADVAAQVHRAVAAVAPGRSATVAIDDIELGAGAGTLESRAP